MEDKPRTDPGQVEDKKDLQRAACRGKVQFYPGFNNNKIIITFNYHDGPSNRGRF